MARRTLLVVLTILLAGLLYASPAFAQCTDCDGDGYEWPTDCDDADPDTYPGAPQICDGLNNDCADAAWPALIGTNEFDNDGDSFSECDEDCNDAASYIYSEADELCDGQDDNCDTVIDEGWDLNGDTVPECTQQLTDIDFTGRVDGFDLAAFSRHFGTANFARDIDLSGSVDGPDQTLLANAFGLSPGDDSGTIDPTGEYSFTVVMQFANPNDSILGDRAQTYDAQVLLDQDTGKLWLEYNNPRFPCDGAPVFLLGPTSGTNAFMFGPSIIGALTWDENKLSGVWLDGTNGEDAEARYFLNLTRCTGCWTCGAGKFPPTDIELEITTSGVITAGDPVDLRVTLTRDDQPVQGDVFFIPNPGDPFLDISPNPARTNSSGIADVVLSTSASETEYIVWARLEQDGLVYDFVIITLGP